MSHREIQTPRKELKKRGTAKFFFNQLRGVWIPDETLFRVFEMHSQTIHNFGRNSKKKLAKFYGIQTTVTVVISFVFSL